MSTAENARHEGPSTEQIAASTGAASAPGDRGTDTLADTRSAATTAGALSPEPQGLPRARLVDDDDMQGISSRWREIQAAFVDEPRTAVQEADTLVAELMQRLAAMFARDRAELEQRWSNGNQVSTEELRQSLRHYRSFFERLLEA